MFFLESRSMQVFSHTPTLSRCFVISPCSSTRNTGKVEVTSIYSYEERKKSLKNADGQEYVKAGARGKQMMDCCLSLTKKMPLTTQYSDGFCSSPPLVANLAEPPNMSQSVCNLLCRRSPRKIPGQQTPAVSHYGTKTTQGDSKIPHAWKRPRNASVALEASGCIETPICGT
ncbi:uncharacterized protein FYN12_006525 isoform 2-T2 [Phoenicopterus ruber ruber]